MNWLSIIFKKLRKVFANKWLGLDAQLMSEFEIDLLTHDGLTISDLTIDKVNIHLGVQNYVSNEDSKDFYIHTVKIRQKEANKTNLNLSITPV